MTLHNDEDRPATSSQGVETLSSVGLYLGLQCPLNFSVTRLPRLAHPQGSPSASIGKPCRIIVVMRAPIYSVCILTDLVVRMLPVSVLASSSNVNRVSYTWFDLLDNTCTTMMRHLSASFSVDTHQFSGFYVLCHQGNCSFINNIQGQVNG